MVCKFLRLTRIRKHSYPCPNILASARASADDRTAACHRFNHGVRTPFIVSRVYKKLRQVVEQGYVFTWYKVEALNPFKINVISLCVQQVFPDTPSRKHELVRDLLSNTCIGAEGRLWVFTGKGDCPGSQE